jgi:hypothetical protein
MLRNQPLYVLRQSATKGFNHNISHHMGLFSGCPRQNFNARCAMWCHPRQGRRIIDPQADGVTALRQIGSQAPTDPEVSVVVYHVAKNIPLQRFWVHSPDCPQYADV